MQFTRVFTDKPDDITWTKRDAKIIDSEGNTVFELKDVEAPSTWSDNSINIVASKYFKKINGVQETSVKQLIKRVVDTIVKWGIDGGYFNPEKYATTEYPADVFADELTWILTHQYACFNSPVLFNFGVPNRPQTGSACFLLDVEDNMDSIRHWYALESKIFQAGSGAGINVSNLREENALLSSGGTSSGPISFMEGADAQAKVIKSGGVTRRAAKLVLMDITHKDIEKFIDCKIHEEKKARVLAAAGYSDGIDGEAYHTVSHQNANYSVRIDDQFMHQVLDGNTSANYLIEKIAKAAWECGDPGILYTDTILGTYTLPNSKLPRTGNPCLEIVNQPPFTACNLASINVLPFLSTKKFDWNLFFHVINILTVALDIICTYSDYPDEEIAINTKKQHHIGLGYTNTGALLMVCGLAYDSDAGRAMIANISSGLTGQSLLTSSYMASELGSFEDYKFNEAEMLKVVQQFADSSLELNNEVLTDLWSKVLQSGKQFGFRNANTTAIAPTGTISFMMGADTTGIEPELALKKTKSMVGNGFITITNPLVPRALNTLGYNDSDIQTICDYIINHNTVVGSNLKKEHESVFATSFGSNSLSPLAHIKMVSAAQEFIMQGISKTCNVPETATIEDVKNIYIKAWELEVKAISIYRNNSKVSQPLNTISTQSKLKAPIVRSIRRSLPIERSSITHKMEVNGFEFYLHVGLFDDGTPGEVFINSSKLGSTLSGLLDSYAIALSFGLQYGVPLDDLVEKFINTRFEPAGFTNNPEIRMVTSIVDYIFRWLKLRFLDNKITLKVDTHQILDEVKAGVKTGELCRCGNQMIRAGTCYTCQYCGETVGGCGA